MSMTKSSFKFIDLFAGIGGFHGAMHMLGGECVFASEIDQKAVSTYERNWNMKVSGDITQITQDCSQIPDHDVLCAGFPCQPFSKSGMQRGMNEARGTLFFHIAKILKEKRPQLFILENVRNLAGPRHKHEWDTIITTLRELGYVVNSRPLIMSPHLLPQELGGRPQIRERVLILGFKSSDEHCSDSVETNFRYSNKKLQNWDPMNWNLYNYIQNGDCQKYNLTEDEIEWLEVWNQLVKKFKGNDKRSTLPSFPLWFDDFNTREQMEKKWAKQIDEDAMPHWKLDILTKNAEFYENNRKVIDTWKANNPQIESFPVSRRKLEWQAQNARSLDETIIHFRPSGIRAKKPTYAPALVAITQTTVLGKEKRRLTPREAARLQAFPEWFKFEGQDDAATYKQLGNAVNINVIYWAFRSFLEENRGNVENVFPKTEQILTNSPKNPDDFNWEK